MQTILVIDDDESLRDTIETIDAMGVDAFVVRHQSSGVPWQIGQWTAASIVNASVVPCVVAPVEG